MCMSEPARVLEVGSDGAEAVVWMRGAERRLSIALLTLEGQTITPGQWLLASAGLAVEVIDAEHAEELLSFTGEGPS